MLSQSLKLLKTHRTTKHSKNKELMAELENKDMDMPTIQFGEHWTSMYGRHCGRIPNYMFYNEVLNIHVIYYTCHLCIIVEVKKKITSWPIVNWGPSVILGLELFFKDNCPLKYWIMGRVKVKSHKELLQEL